MKKHSYLNLEFASPMDKDKVMVVAPTIASKPSSSSNAQNKKLANNYDATESFYYYSGFGPSHGMWRCRSYLKKLEEVEVEPSKYASLRVMPKLRLKMVPIMHGATTYDDDACNTITLDAAMSTWRGTKIHGSSRVSQ
jgi:hypothetical protein